MKKPRVLIFGQSFNSNTGGGITLSNLFNDWDKEDLAVIVTGHGIDNINVKYCDNYYFIGNKENSWKFPFNYFQRKIPSGKLKIESSAKAEVVTHTPGIRTKFINNIFYPILNWTGLFHVLSEINFTPELKSWIKSFDPEVIYIQVSTRESLLFGQQLAKVVDVPIVLHQMDDWISSVSYKGFMGDYWRRRINREYKALVDMSTLCLSISDQMGDSYEKRFGKKFVTYHNPVDVDKWYQVKEKLTVNEKAITILYAGRTGFGIGSSLRSFAQAVEEIREEQGIPLEFYIQTLEPINWIDDFKHTFYRELIPYELLPNLFKGVDYLLLPCDFSGKSIEFLRYSMPTKAPEYMISGTPTIILAPSETAVFQYGSKENWAYTIEKDEVEFLKQKLFDFVKDTDLQKRLTEKAVYLARTNHDSMVIRKRFAKEFADLVETNDSLLHLV